LNALLFFPERALSWSPGELGLSYADLSVPTLDGERLHGWWIPASGGSAVAHVLVLHGNGGNIAGRVDLAQVLTSVARLDVLLLDYRGYGRSTGRPSEQGTSLDARAGLAALRAQPGVDPTRVFYLGESLGGAVALELALSAPPRGLILQSTFTSVRDMARLHYPFIPAPVIPDAYPSLRRVRGLRSPLLVLHGDHDEVVPASHGQALFDAAPEPKRLHVFPGAGHANILDLARRGFQDAIAGFVADQRQPAA
jgi:fermentation-respiration switch protein FrsA (DUF1100 family)